MGTSYLLIHDLGADTDEWDVVASALCRLPDTYVAKIRLHGRGTSLDGNVPRLRWRKDIYTAYNATKSDATVLVGIGLGALLALDFAADNPDDLDGIVAISTAFSRAARLPILRQLEAIAPHHLLEYGDNKILARSMIEMLELGDEVSKKLSSVKAPLLSISSLSDPMRDEEYSTETILAAVPNATLLQFDKPYNSIVNPSDGEKGVPQLIAAAISQVKRKVYD